MLSFRPLLILVTAAAFALLPWRPGTAARASEDAAPAAKPAAEQVDTDLTAKDITGKDCQPLACGDAKAAVVLFVTHDCPISNAYSPEINRIVKEFGERKVVFHLVHPYKELSVDEARKHAKEYGYTVPVIIDADRAVTRAVKARTTPEAIVVSPKGEIAYRGRIDDLYADYGKRRAEPTVRDLRNALTAILSGKPVPNPVTEAVGCPIEQE